MSVTLSVKNVPEGLVARLRDRAKRNHRSMQGELLAMLEEALTLNRLTVDEAYLLVKQLDFRTGSNSVAMVREDRDAR